MRLDVHPKSETLEGEVGCWVLGCATAPIAMRVLGWVQDLKQHDSITCYTIEEMQYNISRLRIRNITRQCVIL